MATLSSPGIGSGLDVASIVNQLVSLEKRPLQQLQTTASRIQSQISVYGQMQAQVTGLRDAAQRLGESSLWRQSTARSADSTQVNASASGQAVAGVYGIQVNQLAQAQSLASAAFATSGSTVGTGTLRIELGAWSAGAGSFTPQDGVDAVEIEIGPEDQTLEQIRDRINAAGAGINATIIRDGTGARLAVTSAQTGVENSVRITASGGDGGLAALAYDPPGGSSAMTQTRTASNAQAVINGLSIESATNQLDNVADGLSLTLLQVTTTEVTITVAPDLEAKKKAITDFVAAYNSLNSFLNTQMRYDEATKKAGALQGDSAARSLQSQLRNAVVQGSAASDVFGRLGDIGLEMQRDGNIKVDNGKLDAAMQNLPELSNLFAATDNGIAARFRSLGGGFAGTEGVLTQRVQGMQDRLRRNATDQDRVNQRAAMTEQRLLRQYTALDVQLGQLSGLSNYVNQQLKQLENFNAALSRR